MALGEGVKCGVVDGEVEEMLGFGCVKYTRGMGRKRIVIFSNVETSPDDSAMHAPLKRQCSGRLSIESDKSALETLPQDILIRILCGVEHEDLKQLVRVSKSIKEAAVIAKQWHFAYKTPTKTRAFRTSIGLAVPSGVDDIETPKAPLRCFKPRLCSKKLVEISTVLFDSP
ncbi:F-box protein SKIP27-like isoform X1 [Punica granatum]|uniref:F-box domain-containing protein n=2 Tax=Punica granatum TaxID=22663 RepID=A0A218XKK0_PUNGR|nr:F-box protein SKIP27-like isoform X1 [Punica granatum]OWM85209.1 hypothetical protein CDL15_Pgr027996 [Punica granatum]PKI51747.1 hypothetical protein CRG98_027910 [Punica granatum]